MDQLLELRALGHAGANRHRPSSGTVTSMQAAILGLQRTAGNRAVASLLSLQRCGGTPCDCANHEPDAIPVQRDDADAGDAPVRLGTTCRVFTGFADDFLGTPPRKSQFAALTAFTFVTRDGRIAADNDQSGSWVNRRRVAVDGRPAQTSAAVRGCEKAMSRPNAVDYTETPSESCPASADIRSPATATSRDECETVIGAQLDTEDQADMARLLRHEQYHMNLACALAYLGNTQVDAGKPVAAVFRQVVAASQREQRAYDNDTKHGCNSGPQGTWEANIDSGTVKFP
jgi:hypothetical protein